MGRDLLSSANVLRYPSDNWRLLETQVGTRVASRLWSVFRSLHCTRILGVSPVIRVRLGYCMLIDGRHNRKFWHQNLQLNLQGPARFITYDVLRLPRTGLIQRYTFTFFVFFVSGCLHTINDMGASIPISDSGALRFFCTQAFGIMFEDGTQEIYRRLGGQSGPLSRMLGYLWVLAFLSWSTAAWQYPVLLVTKKEDHVFRLSPFVH